MCSRCSRCAFNSPYLDAHGEEDPFLRRGRPLQLDEARYLQAEALWASASFDFDSHVMAAWCHVDDDRGDWWSGWCPRSPLA